MIMKLRSWNKLLSDLLQTPRQSLFCTKTPSPLFSSTPPPTSTTPLHEILTMSKAVEMLKKAMLVGRQDWKPNRDILEACIDNLEEQGDADTIDEILQLCKSSGPVKKEMYHRLLRTSIAVGKPVPSILGQMKMDGFSADEEVDKILGTKTNL